MKALIITYIFSSVVPAFAQWTTFINKDEMTGEQSNYTQSQGTAPTQKMGFPYDDVTAWLGVGCKDLQEWAYVGFSESPNFTGTTTKDGHSEITTRIKWDDQIESVTLTQKWGSSFVHFSGDTWVISKIAASNEALLEFNWYGEGTTYFRFALGGSSLALANMRRACSENSSQEARAAMREKCSHPAAYLFVKPNEAGVTSGWGATSDRIHTAHRGDTLLATGFRFPRWKVKIGNTTGWIYELLVWPNDSALEIRESTALSNLINTPCPSTG